VGAVEGCFSCVVVGGDVEALVEGENEVCAEFLLDLHGDFGCEAVFGLVDVACECNAVVVNLAEAVI